MHPAHEHRGLCSLSMILHHDTILEKCHFYMPYAISDIEAFVFSGFLEELFDILLFLHKTIPSLS